MDRRRLTLHRLASVVVVLLCLVGVQCTRAAGWQTAVEKFKNLQTFKQEVVGSRGVVAANHPIAAVAGQQILAKGGNAVDAVVATFFTLSVVEPDAMSPFGAGFINIHTKDGKSITLDNYTVAPAAAAPGMFTLAHPDDERKQAEGGHQTVNNENEVGFKSIGVPGGMKAWLWALKNHGSGKLSLRAIMQPAIDAAEFGWRISPVLERSIENSKARNGKFPGWSAEFVPGGVAPKAGELLQRPAYAVTLKAIADAAPAGASFADQLEAAGTRFYKGDIAKNIIGYLQSNGGIMTLDDLAWYYGQGLDDVSMDQGLRPREPVHGTYRGYDIIAMPPTSSGGTHIVEILNILEGYDLKALGFGNPKALHLMAEAMKIAWADRDAYMGDPDYGSKDPSYRYPPVPVKELTSKEYAAQRRREIDEGKPGTYKPGVFGGGPTASASPYNGESASTTHATAMDSDGNIVAMTQTIHHGFGSGVVLPGMVPGSGLCLNDTMELFDPDPRPGFERANAIAPRKRMLSSMSPTLVLKDGKPFMGIGTPGSVFIYSAVLQGILNVIDHGMNIQQAVEAPRMWSMMYGDVNVENGFPQEVVDELAAMGHSIKRVRAVAGGMNGVLMDQAQLIHGGACWRRDGAAAAWSGGNALEAGKPYPAIWDSPVKKQ